MIYLVHSAHLTHPGTEPVSLAIHLEVSGSYFLMQVLMKITVVLISNQYESDRPSAFTRAYDTH